MSLIIEREILVNDFTLKHKEENMAKRLVSTALGILILALVFISQNLFVINLAVTIVSIIGLFEFYNAFKAKGIKPFEAIGYIVSLGILSIGYLDNNTTKALLFVALPIILFVLFCKSVFTNNKYNVIDVAVTLLGIAYIPLLLSFISFTCHLTNGLHFVWYILAGAWVTDSFAYLVGCKFGKHKFSEISPKKSIEGCVGGVIGCALFYFAYTYYLKSIGVELNYLVMIVLGALVSVISQIGDLAASSVKRYCGEKDFGTIMPGHGGILDRFDSVIMIAPFVYMFFQFLV